MASEVGEKMGMPEKPSEESAFGRREWATDDGLSKMKTEN